MPRMEGGASGEENANLYVRGVEEGRRGEQPDPSELIELLVIQPRSRAHTNGTTDAQ